MEGTGVVDKIHVTQATADLLIQDGKQHWVSRRKEAIEAKGKGVIQTYCACNLASVHCSLLIFFAPHFPLFSQGSNPSKTIP